MNNKAHKQFVAEPTPETKSFLDADSQLAELELRLEAAAAEVTRLKRAIAAQRSKTGSLFVAARDADERRTP